MANEVPGEIKEFTEGVPATVNRHNELVAALNWCRAEIVAMKAKLDSFAPLTCIVFGNDAETLTIQRIQTFGLVVKQLGSIDCNGGSGDDIGGA